MVLYYFINHEQDVVPANEAMWTKGKPFEANKDESGNIYARGTQGLFCFEEFSL